MYDKDGNIYDEITYGEIWTAAFFATNANYDQTRMWVYAKHNTWDLCVMPCPMQMVDMCLSSTQPTPDANDNEMFFGKLDNANIDALAGDDYINTGLGNDFITLGGPGDDILEDHAGRDVMKGGPGSDILISRSGGDVLYGGGMYTDVLGAVVAAEDAEGDCNTYVIYPTSEKDHHFDWTPTNTKTAATYTCTKICGMQLYDTIEFRADDPTFEDYKYTDDDDTCALRVDGWEIEWYLAPGLVDDDGATGFVPETSILDIWFSRETGMAHICLNVETVPANMCSGGPDGEVSNDYCLAYWVQCVDQDPWPDTDLDDYITNLEILNWYGYW